MQVWKSWRAFFKTFFQYMDAQAIAEALLSREVIPKHIQAMIVAAGREEANEILFHYLPNVSLHQILSIGTE